MLLQGICVYNYNQICEVHVMQIKTMTEGYDRPLSQTIRLQTMYLIDVFLCFCYEFIDLVVVVIV